MKLKTLSSKIWMPTDLREAWRLRQLLQLESHFIAGGTLWQTKWEKGAPQPSHLISLENIKILEAIYEKEDGGQNFLHLGALIRLADCLRHPIIKAKWPLLTKAVKTIAAPAVRNLGTIGGNVASTIGDAIPALLVMEAKIGCFDGDDIKKIDLDHWLNEEFKDDLITEIVVPEISAPPSYVHFYQKIGRREAFSGSVVTIAGIIGQNDNGTIDFARLAAGGGENRPRRLRITEQLLDGRKVESALLKKVHEAVFSEFQPVGDAFFSADYRRRVAANIVIAELKKLEEKD
ncbi:FAD binding domain-containing protein [Aeribacillus pallidus]|uniref:Xanthine dehydrogenase n=1 Tax=Aeribacillus pallidus TaxID=33936 RepID=A0A165YVJ1_9BACI|nr:FAD binding domain-containing protein [Aeribacillus pallidus]KZN97496.1 xanthine dehydrogenase [Aeribacillus pallidus]